MLHLDREAWRTEDTRANCPGQVVDSVRARDGGGRG